MRTELVVTITPEDFKASPGGYVNLPQGGCVLWQALHRLYPGMYIYVGAHAVGLGHDEYLIDRKMWGYHEPNTRSYIGEEGNPYGLSAERITRLSDLAKESLDGIPTVTLTLTPQ